MSYSRIHLSLFVLIEHYWMKLIQYVMSVMLGGAISLSAMAATNTPLPHHEISPSDIKIGIIGSGWLGGTIGKLLVNAGYEVMFSSQDLDSDQLLAKQLGTHAHAGTPKQAAKFGSVVILAVPYGAIPSLGKELDTFLKGKVVLDGTNPYEGRDGAIATEALKNGAGITTLKYFPDTKVVRVFNGVDASQIQASSTRSTNKLGIPIAGDDQAAVHLAAQLVSAIGSEPVIVGNLVSANTFQPNGPGFRKNTSAEQLRHILGLTK